MRARMEGQLTSSLAGLNDRAGKLGAKLVKQLNQKQGNAYTYAFPLGVTYPTNDQLVYGLQSRDMLAAMGVVPQPVDQVPGPSLVGASGNDLPPQPPVIQPPAVPPFNPPPPVPSLNPPPPPHPQPQPKPGGGFTVPPPPQHPPTGGGGFGVPPPPPQPQPQPAPQPKPGGGFGVPPPVNAPPTLPPAGGPSTNPCPPGMVPGPGIGNYPTPPATIPPAIVFGWAPPGQPPVIGTSGGVPTVQPWGPGVSGPPGTDAVLVCVDGSHLSPPGAGQVQWFIPGGFSLWVDTVNGHVTAAASMPGANYTLVPLVPCDPNAPDPIYHPGGGTGGPQCVPGPPACGPGGGGGGGGGAGTGGQPPPPVCGGPPVNPPPPGPPAPGQLPPGADSCATFEAYLQAIRQSELQVGSWIGMAVDPQTTLGTISQAVVNAIIGGNGPIIPWVVQRFASWMQKLLDNMAKGLPCDPIAMAPVVTIQGMIRFIDGYLHCVPEQLKVAYEQLSNYVCQSILPAAGPANAAWLAGSATDDDWLCWTKAAGHQIAEATKIRDGERHKPSVAEVTKLNFRTLIDDKTYTKLMRQNGVTDQGEQDYMLQASRPWPAEHEVISWAGEQLFDPDTVTRFHLDDGFDDLYKDQFKLWWEASGRNQDMARKDWEAHWKRPGVGQLIEMVRRLRPGKVDADVQFTQDDLDASLKQEGYNGFWVKRVKAISYRVAQRRDVQRLYQYHQVDETGMKDLLQDQGYEDQFADQLVSSWGSQRKQTESRYNGAPQASALVRDYANGLMARSELETQVAQIVYYDGQDQEILDNADLARTLQERKLAVSGLKGLFTKGLVKIEDAQAQLAQLGMDNDAISELTQYWARVVKSKPKQVPAATLCTWRTDGLISAAEQFTALSNLGYQVTDANFIVEDCTIKIAKAQEAAQQKALKAAQAAAQKAEAAATKAAANAKRRVKIVTSPGQNGTGVPAGGP